MRMKNGEVTEADDPFWLLNESCKIEFINDANHAISTSCAHDRFDSGIIEHLLKIGRSFMIRARECEISFAYCVPTLVLNPQLSICMIEGRFLRE